MPVRFSKMHGAGNDFVVLDLREQAFHIDSATAARLADRHLGIGCDQVLVLRPATTPGHLASFEIWNADGSRAEQCGNGVRCLGLYLDRRNEATDGVFELGGPAGVVRVRCMNNGQVQVDMGKPRFSHDQLPVSADAGDGWLDIDVEGHNIKLGVVSMGNPHALMIVDDLENTDVASLGPAISRHPVFPNGCNAGFTQVMDRGNIRLRVFERGAAETLACGSGACAAVSILRNAGMVDEKVNVTQAGGVLIIRCNGQRSPVLMTGPATHVFDGKWNDQ